MMNTDFIFAKNFVSQEILEQEWESYQNQKIEKNFYEYLIAKKKMAPIAKDIVDQAISVKKLQFINDRDLINHYQNYIGYIQKQIAQKTKYVSFVDWLHKQNILMIGRYQIVEQLGKGGFGKVYKAYDPQLEKYVAIKMLLELDNWERFKQEMKICAHLDHPNIVPVFDCGEHDHIPYMIMKFVRGETLSDRIKKGMNEEEIKTILGKIAMALEVAHNSGIIHRDLKPSNIIIDQNNEPIILDFGIAKAKSQTEITKTNEIIGSIHYMSPEMLNQGNVSKTSDVYALGVILYEMLTGTVPYKESNTAALIFKVINQDPSFDGYQGISKTLQAVCLKAMNKQPSCRFPTAREFADALATEKYIAEIKTTRKYAPRLKKEVRAKVDKNKSKIQKRYIALAIVCIVLISSLFFLNSSHQLQIFSPNFYYGDEFIDSSVSYVSMEKNLSIEVPENTFFYVFDKNTKLEQYYLDNLQKLRKISIALKELRGDQNWHFICTNRKLTTEEIGTIFKKTEKRGIGDLGKYYNNKQQVENSSILFFLEISSDFSIKPRNKFIISPSSFVVEPLVKIGTSKFTPMEKENIVKEGDLLKIKIEAILPNHYLLIFFKHSEGLLLLFPPIENIENIAVVGSYQEYESFNNVLYLQDPDKEGFRFDANKGKEHIIACYNEEPINFQQTKKWIEESDLSLYIKKTAERGIDHGNYYKQVNKPPILIDIFEIDHQ